MRKSVNQLQIKCEKIKNLPKNFPASHGWGFCSSLHHCACLNRDYFIFSGGCITRDLKKDVHVTREIELFFSYNPFFHKFSQIFKSIPNSAKETVGISSLYKTTSIIRSPTPNIKEMIVFGGFDKLDVYQNNVFSYDLFTGKWCKIDAKTPPQPIVFHQSLYKKSNDSMYVFGGKHKTFFHPSGSTRVNSIYKCSFKSLEWTSTTFQKSLIQRNNAPSERSGHCLAWTNEQKQCSFITFGGVNNDAVYMNETWIYDLETKKWKNCEKKGNPPSPRSSHTSICVNNNFYVFGGSMGASSANIVLYNDLYRMNLKTFFWEKIDIVGDIVTPLYLHRVGKFVRDGKIKIFSIGGYYGNKSSSTSDIYVFNVNEDVKDDWKHVMNTNHFADIKIITF